MKQETITNEVSKAEFLKLIPGKTVFISWEYSMNKSDYIAIKKESIERVIRNAKPIQIKYWYASHNLNNIYIDELQF